VSNDIVAGSKIYGRCEPKARTDKK